VMVHCMFFNFVEPFDFWCCSLFQEMNFVVCCLPCFRLWPCSDSLPAFQAICLLIVCMEIRSLTLPLSLVHFHRSCPFHCVLVFSALFIVQVFLFSFCGRVSLPRGLCWFILGVTGEYCITFGAHLFGECLPATFGATGGSGDGGNGGNPPVFLV
jgi:hypothetical protein